MQIICRTCRRPLNRSDLPDGGSVWSHGLGQAEYGDHQPDAVLGDPHSRCDVCNREPVVAILLVTGTIHLAPAAVSHDPWALCATCRALIMADDWDGLLDHASTALHAPAAKAGITATQLTDQLRPIHTQLRAQASGPPVELSTSGGPTDRVHSQPPDPEAPPPVA